MKNNAKQQHKKKKKTYLKWVSLLEGFSTVASKLASDPMKGHKLGSA